MGLVKVMPDFDHVSEDVALGAQNLSLCLIYYTEHSEAHIYHGICYKIWFFD